MTFDLTLIKKHWLVLTGVVIGGAVLVFLYLKKRSAANASSSNAAPDISSEAQFASIAAGQNLQNAQLNAQTEVAQLSAQVATNQTNAQLQAALASIDAAKSINESNNQTTLATTQINADVASQSITSQQLVALGQQASDVQQAQIVSDTTLGQTQIIADYQNNVVKLQSDVAEKQVGLMQTIFDTLAAKKVFNGDRSSTGITQILAAIYGKGPQALANTNPAAYNGVGISIPGIGSLSVGG